MNDREYFTYDNYKDILNIYVYDFPRINYEIGLLQVLYNLTLLYAVVTTFMFTHVLVFYTPFVHTATVEQREHNELSDGQVIHLFIDPLTSTLIFIFIHHQRRRADSIGHGALHVKLTKLY